MHFYSKILVVTNPTNTSLLQIYWTNCDSSFLQCTQTEKEWRNHIELKKITVDPNPDFNKVGLFGSQ